MYATNPFHSAVSYLSQEFLSLSPYSEIEIPE